jgi:hypothetical protein
VLVFEIFCNSVSFFEHILKKRLTISRQAITFPLDWVYAHSLKVSYGRYTLFVS